MAYWPPILELLLPWLIAGGTALMAVVLGAVLASAEAEDRPRKGPDLPLMPRQRVVK
jgi:hypothetical protein